MPSNAQLNKENQQANSVAQCGCADATQGAAAQPKMNHKGNPLSNAFNGVKQRFNNLSRNASKALNDSKKRHDRKQHHKEQEHLYGEKNVEGVDDLINHPDKFEKL